MLKFLKKSFSSVSFLLLAVTILLAPAKALCMEYDDMEPKNPLSVIGSAFANFISDPLRIGDLVSISESEKSDLVVQSGINSVEGLGGYGNGGLLDESYENKKSFFIEKGVPALNRYPLSAIPSNIIGTARQAVAESKNLVDSKIAKAVESTTKPIVDNYNKLNSKISSSVDLIYSNKYKIAGGAIAGVIATVVLVKATQLLCEKTINWVIKTDPKFLANVHQKNIFYKIKNFVGFKSDKSLFLNNENSENIPAFILKNSLVSKFCDKEITYKNLVLTGPDKLVKFKVCEYIAENSCQKLVAIDVHSSLFNQDVNNEQKRILVKNFFDKLQSNGSSLVLVNLDHVSIEQLENNGYKNILVDIVNYSKGRFNKLGFVFACPSIEGEYKKLLEGSYDEIINIERPDKNSREQIVNDLVNKLILNASNVSTLQKLGITSGFLTVEKQQAFKEYFTQEKLNWVVDSLDGKSYQEVQNFVKQLRAFMGQKTVGAIKNYDVFINILLNRTSSVFSGKNSSLNLSPENYLEAIIR